MLLSIPYAMTISSTIASPGGAPPTNSELRVPVDGSQCRVSTVTGSNPSRSYTVDNCKEHKARAAAAGIPQQLFSETLHRLPRPMAMPLLCRTQFMPPLQCLDLQATVASISGFYNDGTTGSERGMHARFHARATPRWIHQKASTCHNPRTPRQALRNSKGFMKLLRTPVTLE